MKHLMLVAASALVLGVAGVGSGHAAEPYNSSSATPRSNLQMPSGTTTSVNASEDQIKAVQEQLKTAGLYAGDVDGIIGRQTKQALQEFQQQHGLQMTGRLDQQTLAALQSNTGQAGSTAAPSNGHAPRAGGLNRNSSGNPPQR